MATLPASAARRHPVSLDIPSRMAKAHVQKVDSATEPDWMVAVGHAIALAIATAGLSQKEAAAVIGVDQAEFGKWLNGQRRPQFDRIFAVETLRQPLVIELARLAGTFEIVTELRTVTA